MSHYVARNTTEYTVNLTINSETVSHQSS